LLKQKLDVLDAGLGHPMSVDQMLPALAKAGLSRRW